MNKYFIKILLILIPVIFSFNKIYAQHDSDSLKNILLIWNLEDNFKKKTVLLSDSSAEIFHKTFKEEKLSILTSNLGNYGSANISDIFIKRDDLFNREFSFNSPYFIFIKNSKNVKYFNTRRPFTSIMHTTSTKIRNIQTLNFIHTQNINPNLNFAVDFDFFTSIGQVDFQKTNLNTSAISLNYKKKRYELYTSYVHNKINNENSGGFDISKGSSLSFPPPNIQNANILLKNQELSATQKYNFGNYKNLSFQDTIIKVLEPKVSLSHNINLYRKYRVYTDEENELLGSEIYNLFNFQKDFTIDSVSLNGISNKIKFGSEKIFEEKNKFGFSFILEGNLKEYYNFKDYIILENSSVFFENNISGEVYSGNFLNLQTSLYTKYYFSGYRKNDFRINANVLKEDKFNKRKIQYYLNTCFSFFKPDFYFNNFYSNHNIWENDFTQTKKFDFSLNMAVTERKFKVSFDASYIINHVYFNSIREPAQFDFPIYILTANVNKTFKLSNLFIENNLYWQNSSNLNVISLPEFAAYHSTYLKFQYENNLLTYIGYEIYISTQYKALSFNSSGGQFYLEDVNAQVIGNYPFIGAFINLKIKRNVMISLKFQHINSGFFKEIYPVQINNYPVYDRLFKFAIRWTFKN